MPNVLAQREASALVLTLNRPESGNAISLDVARELRAALELCHGDASVRSVVLTGAGPRYFCTGGDVKRYAALKDAEELAQAFGTVRELLDFMEALEQPVIAAINGYAVGGGTELALACDTRIAAASAQIGLPQSRLGIMPGWDGTARLVENVGRSTAMRLLLTGERVSAQEALRIGLVDEVAAEGKVLDAALAFARKLDLAAPASIAAAKRAVLAALRDERNAAREWARQEFARLWFSADHKEAERAFAEKRTPRFSKGA